MSDSATHPARELWDGTTGTRQARLLEKRAAARRSNLLATLRTRAELADESAAKLRAAAVRQFLARDRTGLTVTAIAEAAGVDRGTLYAWAADAQVR